MSLICTDCGCDDIRTSKDMGQCCNNCGSRNFRHFDRNHVDYITRKLMQKYKKDIVCDLNP